MDERGLKNGLEKTRRERRELFEAQAKSYEVPDALAGKSFFIKKVRYELKKCIGYGGFGEVWQAEKSDGKEIQKIAVKISNPFKRSWIYLDQDDISEEDASQMTEGEFDRIQVAENTRRLWREVVAAKQLGREGSPYPKFIDAQFVPFPGNEDERMLVLVMEEIEGNSLFDLVSEGLKNEKYVLNLAYQIAQGVKYTHDAGFVHRDIKPENILVEKGGRVRMVDLGLVTFRSPKENMFLPYQKTNSHFNVGSFGFMYRGDPDAFGVKRDVYALGKTFLEMNAQLSNNQNLQNFIRLIKRMTDEDPGKRPEIEEVIAEIQKLQAA